MHVNQLGFLAALLAIQCIQQSYFGCYAKSRQASWNKKTHKIAPTAFGEIRINERKKPGQPSNGTNPGAPSNGPKPSPPSNGSGGGNSTKQSKSTKSHRNEARCGSRDLNANVTEVKQLYKNDDDLENLMFEHLEGEKDFGVEERELDDCVIDVSINWTEPIVRDDDFYLRLGQEYMYNIQINITQDETVLYNPLFDSPFLVRVSSAPVWFGKEHIVRSNFQQEYFSENSSYAEVEVPMTLQMPTGYDRNDVFFSTMVNIIFFGTNDTNVVKQFVIAKVLPGDMLYLRQPSVLENGTIIWVLSAIIIIPTIPLMTFFLYNVIRHRDHSVMKLSQWQFLVAIIILSMLAVIGTRFITTENKLTCSIGIVPSLGCSYLILTVVIGRLWRSSLLLSSVIQSDDSDQSHLRRKRLAQLNDFFSYLTQWKACSVQVIKPVSGRARRSSIGFRKRSTILRNIISISDLRRLLIVLSIPMVITMICSFVFSSNIEPGYIYDSTYAYKKKVCDVDQSWTSSTRVSLIIAFVLVTLQQLLCLYMAYLTSDLPSLFNETLSIYRSVCFSFLVTLLFVPMSFFAHAPTTSSEVPNILTVLALIVLPMSMTWSLIYPKLVIIWSGEQIVVSELLSEKRTSHVTHEDEVSRKDSLQSKEDNFEKSLRKSQILEGKSCPVWIERKIMTFNSLTSRIMNNSISGRMVKNEDWLELKELITEFGSDLEYVTIGNDIDEESTDC